ncbi:integrase family protein [Paraburkholderia sp. J63]|uniref:integrase family protein n=1 Tax=Paraburkholderia sp. J63 TaxID=2805434 RepID=UPI002ABD9520|nr:integrase family protein [Paraburkholderia sp. J63]
MKNHTGKPLDGGWTGSWNAKHNPPANTSHILQWLANTTPLKSPSSAAGFAAGSPIARSDGDGLTFTLTDNSTATWVLRYGRGSRRRELTLGSYLEPALSEARKKTRMYRVRIDAGENPAADQLAAVLPGLDDKLGRRDGLMFRILLATCVRQAELVQSSRAQCSAARAIRGAFERNAFDMRRFTPHDTRSTAKGHLRNLGFSREISEIALNHKLQGTEGIYDVREEIPERREAMEAWARFIERCCIETPPQNQERPDDVLQSSVTPFRQRSAA